MRKHLIITACILSVNMFVISSCKKETTEPLSVSEQEDIVSGRLANKNIENSCRLANFDWPGFGTWRFHYNDKGLADQWTIDFGFGNIVEETMYYDENNRLIRAEEDFFGANYIYHFYYAGKRLSRLTRTNVDFPEDAFDFTYTYNSNGQNTRQDDNIHDQHVLMYYDPIGNCTRTDIYFGSDLWFSDIYTFNIPSRNPKLNIPGVETGFPFYGTANVPDKWWFSSNKGILYDNGNPIVLNDYDPALTTLNTGNHNFPGSASYYDRVTESNVNLSFDYENCAGVAGRIQNRQRQVNTKERNNPTQYDPPQLLRSSSKSIKERVLKLREQYKMGIK